MTDEELAFFIGNKIKEYRKLKGLTQKELAKSVGMGDTTIANYEKGFRTPKKNTLFKLAKVFNISIDDLFPQQGNFINNENKTPIQFIYDELNDHNKPKLLNYGNKLLSDQKAGVIVEDKITSIEEYRDRVDKPAPGKVSAGTGYWQEDDYDTMVSFYKDDIPDDDEYDTIAIVVGRSMEPRIKNGDFLFIKVTSQIEYGEIGVFQVNGENYVKQLKKDYLKSLNPDCDDIPLSEEDDIRTIGKVVDVYRED